MSYSAIKLSGAANDGKSVKQTITQSGNGFTAGDVIRWNTGSDGNNAEYVKAQANSAFNSEVIGVIESIPNATDFVVVYSGEIDMGEFGLPTTEDVWFLSADSPGELDSTPPTSGGEVIKPVITKLSAGKGLVTNYIGTAIGGKSTVSLDSIQPIGQIIPWAGGQDTLVNDIQLPNGWKFCNGATLDITEYDEFYKHIRWFDCVASGDCTPRVPIDGYGNADTDEGINTGWATRYGWQQEIVLETIAPGLTTGTWIYQGQVSNPDGSEDWAPGLLADPADDNGSRFYNGTEPYQLGHDTNIVIGQVLYYNNDTKTITVDVNGLRLADDSSDIVAGTDETYLHRRWNQFGAWDADGLGGATLSYMPETTDNGATPQEVILTQAIASAKVTHTKVPDMRGRVPMGADKAQTGNDTIGRYWQGSYGGKEEHILSSDEMPAHKHEFLDEQGNSDDLRLVNYTHQSTIVDSGSWNVYDAMPVNNSIQEAGGSKPHTNMQPWLAVNYLIRVSTLAQAALLEDISNIKMHELKDAHIDYETVAGGSFGNMLFYEHDSDGNTYGWYDHLPLVRNLSPSSNEDLVFYTSQSDSDLVGTEKMRLTQAGELSVKGGISADGGITVGNFTTSNVMPMPSNKAGAPGECIPLIVGTDVSNRTSLNGIGNGGSSFLVSLVTYENNNHEIGTVDEDPIMTLYKVFNVPEGNYLRIMTNNGPNGVDTWKGLIFSNSTTTGLEGSENGDAGGWSYIDGTVHSGTPSGTPIDPPCVPTALGVAWPIEGEEGGLVYPDIVDGNNGRSVTCTGHAIRLRNSING